MSDVETGRTEPESAATTPPPGTTVSSESAVVAELFEDRATLLVGDAAEPWDFPIEMLPERIELGSFLLIEMHDGRPASVQVHREHEEVARKGLDHRLARLARYEQLTGHEVRVS